jgi:hypothetical protein
VVGRRADGSPADRPLLPTPGRTPAGRRVDDRPPVPPVRGAVGVRTSPSRRERGAGSDGPARSPVRNDRPEGPLVAAPVVIQRQRRPEPSGRMRRFVRRHGWRAYAVPALAVVTVVTLADLALTSPGESTVSHDTVATAPVTQPPVVESPPPADPPPAGPTAPQADAGSGESPAETAAQPYVESGAGSVTVVDGDSNVLGSGPTRRFVVEVENGIDVDGAGFARAVEEILGDPRSWGAGGRMSFQRVGTAAAASDGYDFRVSLISPGSMEKYCPGVGTGGYTSCRYGERAVINLARWATAVPDYADDVAMYRHYVVNHEVGHILGNSHQNCPGDGRAAPVMMQQTFGLKGCAKNAWPYP